MLDPFIYSRSSVVIDGASGRVLKNPKRKSHLGNMRGDARTERAIDDTLGGMWFQWWNPDIVQREYDLQAGSGQRPIAPEVSFADVLMTARRDVIETGQDVSAALSQGVKLLAITAASVGVLYVIYLHQHKKK